MALPIPITAALKITTIRKNGKLTLTLTLGEKADLSGNDVLELLPLHTGDANHEKFVEIVA